MSSVSSNEKKIVILAMSCNLDFFKKEEEVLRTSSYAKDVIAGKFKNIDFFSYSASTDGKVHFKAKDHRIEVSADDSISGTYDKTLQAIEVLDALNIEYDYILRTNCSTYINVQVLDKFVQQIPAEDTDKIFGSWIYSTYDASGPDYFDFYAVGNSMLIPKSWVDILKTERLEDYKKYDRTDGNDDKSIYTVDDNIFGFIVNTYCENNGISKTDVWKCWRGIESVTRDFIDSRRFLNYIAIPIRIYDKNRNREDEFLYHRFLQSKVVDLDFTGIDVYKIQTEYQIVKLVNYEKQDYATVMKDDALFFRNHLEQFGYSVERFIKYLKEKQAKM